MTQDRKTSSKKIISINEGLVQSQVSEMVRETVEDTLNAMLEARADRLIGEQRYERTGARKDTRGLCIRYSPHDPVFQDAAWRSQGTGYSSSVAGFSGFFRTDPFSLYIRAHWR